jgi:hypothetical protein
MPGSHKKNHKSHQDLRFSLVELRRAGHN